MGEGGTSCGKEEALVGARVSQKEEDTEGCDVPFQEIVHSGCAPRCEEKDQKLIINTPPSKRSVSGLSSETFRRNESWADMSENIDIDDEDDEDDVDLRGFFFAANNLRNEVTQQVQATCANDAEWNKVGAALDALPGMVGNAITCVIERVTGEDVSIPQRQVDVPLEQRGSSVCAVEPGSLNGMLLTGRPWIPAESELGQWYELQLSTINKVRGVALRGDFEQQAWVSVVKLKTKNVEGVWTDVEDGKLFQACYNASDVIEISFEPISAVAVRIYPVVWHGRIALHAALLEPAVRLSLQQTETTVFRDHARQALTSMMSSKLQVLKELSSSMRQKKNNITELVKELYMIPKLVAEAATQLEATVVADWQQRARDEEGLQTAQQWLQSFPDELNLAVGFRAQAVAMDQISTALGILEGLQAVTASSVAEIVLRAKTLEGETPSEAESLARGLHRRSKTPSSRVAGSVGTLGTVRETLSEGDLSDTAEYHGGEAAGRKRDHSPGRDTNELEFWVDLFVHVSAFRVGGPLSSLVWACQEVNYTVFSEMGVLLHGNATAGKIVILPGFAEHRKLLIVVEVAGVKLAAPLDPLRRLSSHSFLQDEPSVISNAIFELVGQDNIALSVHEGSVGLTFGRQGWRTETEKRHWCLSRRNNGMCIRHAHTNLELTTNGFQVVVCEAGQPNAGKDWELRTINSELYLVSGASGVGIAPGGSLIFCTDSAVWVKWYLYQQSHCETVGMDSAALRWYQPGPDNDIFKAAEMWRKSRFSNARAR